jgi:hypothetical protein
VYKRQAIIALIITAISSFGIPPALSITANVIIPPVAPLIIPQISPTTSLQILLTISALLSRYNAWLAPFIFFDDIDTNGVTSAAAIEIPIVSKTIPIKINTSNKINAKGSETVRKNDSAIKLIEADKINVNMTILTTQLYALFFRDVSSLDRFFKNYNLTIINLVAT